MHFNPVQMLICGMNIGWQVTQVRAVFRIPPKAETALFANLASPGYLAYVDWFTPFAHSPDPNHGLYKVSHSYKNGYRLSSVVPISQIKRSVHLFPDFGASVPREWTSSSVLEACKVFYLNPFADRHSYVTMY